MMKEGKASQLKDVASQTNAVHRSLKSYLLKVAIDPKFAVHQNNIEEYIKYMRDHTPIAFLCVGPLDKSLS